MSSLTISLEVARSTLLNTQVQMGTVSQNIANADNPAYARQKALLATNPALKTAAGYLGTGARVDQIIQQRDQYVERSLMRSIASQSDYEARATALATVGAQLLDDGDEGISSALGTFWDAWEALSQNPSGLSERTAVTQATTNLASVIRDASSRLADTAADLELEVLSEVGTVNDLLERIASLNEAIRLSEGGGQSANDLRDLRYQALTNLAESLPISYQEETNDTPLTITIEDASTQITLVSGHEYGELGYDTTEHQLNYTDYQVSTYGDFELSAGRLNGLMTEYRATGTANDLAYVLANPDAPDLTYADRLNAFASMLITEVNDAFGADVFIGTSVGGIISAEMIKSMAPGAIVFALANPVPEIMPDLAKEAGAKIVATGRSDFPNQINNVLAFPGIFRGALDVRSREINESMKLAATDALADAVGDDRLSVDYILPKAFEPGIARRVALAVAKASLESGSAKLKISPDDVEAIVDTGFKKVG